MTNLLIFFALPVATIIISIALQKIFHNPFLVAAIIFAIFLVVTFVIDDVMFLVPTIIYTILSYITAVITKWICRLINEYNENHGCTNNTNVNVVEITDEPDSIDVNPKVLNSAKINRRNNYFGANYRYR